MDGCCASSSLESGGEGGGCGVCVVWWEGMCAVGPLDLFPERISCGIVDGREGAGVGVGGVVWL